MAEAWKLMLRYPHHTYMLLTKRPDVMVKWGRIHPWPSHIWAGVTVESQEYVSRLDALARVPAKVRFVSCEPLLGPLDLTPWLGYNSPGDGEYCPRSPQDTWIHWVIVGGESGPNARPMHPDWARSLRDQCATAGVPFFHKQNGEWAGLCPYYETDDSVRDRALDAKPSIVTLEGRIWMPESDGQPPPGSWLMRRVGRKAAGELLDGRQYHALPEGRA